MKRPSDSTGVPSKTTSKKQRVREYLETRRPAAITGEVWEELLRAVGPVSESYLREVLRATGLPFEQPWAGVRQGSFEELEQSLLELGQVYAEANAGGRRDLARYCRRQVIAAKDHARFAARNSRQAGGKRRDGGVDARVAGGPGGLPGLDRDPEVESGARVAVSRIACAKPSWRWRWP